MKRADVRRSFLLGRTAGEVVVIDRIIVADILEWHGSKGLKTAAAATRANNGFNDFMTSRGAMLAGGLHLVRLRGGRGIGR
jgi:hypothetical protein